MRQHQEISQLLTYFGKQVEALLKPPAGCLRHPFLVAGVDVYRNELWD